MDVGTLSVWVIHLCRREVMRYRGTNIRPTRVLTAPMPLLRRENETLPGLPNANPPRVPLPTPQACVSARTQRQTWRQRLGVAGNVQADHLA